jgi:hypothetical protein
MDLEALIAGIVRFRSGRPGAELQMLSILSATNLLAVVEEPAATGQGAGAPVSIRLGSVDGRSSAYLFTSETLLSAWCTRQSWRPVFACLSGVELSLSLAEGAWVEIDPGTPHHVVLSPKQLERLAQPFDKGAAGSVSDDSGFTRWTDKEQGESKPSLPAELFPAERSEAAATESAEVASDPQQPAKKRPFMRSNPTTIFAAPTLDKKTDLESRPRTYTSSNLKKIIRPTKPDGSE